MSVEQLVVVACKKNEAAAAFPTMSVLMRIHRVRNSNDWTRCMHACHYGIDVGGTIKP